MNTLQLKNALVGVKNFHGVYGRDEFIQQKLRDGTYIVNTQPIVLPGEHWFVVDIRNNFAIIFDSYGFISPVSSSLDIIDHIRTQREQIFINSIPFQSLDTNVCGDYCVFYILCVNQGSKFHDIMNSLFSSPNSHQRDHRLRKIMLEQNLLTMPRVGTGNGKVHIQTSFSLVNEV